MVQVSHKVNNFCFFFFASFEKADVMDLKFIHV